MTSNVSSSKARRLRNAETKRRLYNECVTEKGHVVNRSGGIEKLLMQVLCRIDSLDFKIDQTISSVFWPSYGGVWESFNSSDEPCFGEFVPQVYSAQCDLDPSAKVFEPIGSCSSDGFEKDARGLPGAEIDKQATAQSFYLMPSVGTWLLHSQPHCKKSSPDILVDHVATLWTEEQTGEYVKMLLSQYQSAAKTNENYKRFEDGMEHAKTLCPASNRPWIEQLTQDIRLNFLLTLRVNRTSSGSEDPASILDADSQLLGEVTAARDQEWEDEATGRWWYQGRLICYFCGESDCLQDQAFHCERRRNEVSLGEERNRRKKIRKQKRV